MTTDSPYLNLLKNRINLSRIPFSERGSRLLVFHADDQLAVRLAERWFKREGQLSGYRQRPPLIDELRFTDGEGRPLEMKLTTYPHRVDCETDIGTFTLTYVDTETLLVALPACACGMTFIANLDTSQTDRRGGVLRLTGDIRRNIAYTTNAPLLRNETKVVGSESQAIRLTFDAASGGKALLLNITPRLGFNRWIPDPETALAAATHRWHEWCAAAPPVTEAYRTR